MMPLTIRWSVERVTPTPTPKLISHSGETFRSIDGTICCCCCAIGSKLVTGPSAPEYSRPPLTTFEKAYDIFAFGENSKALLTFTPDSDLSMVGLKDRYHLPSFLSTMERI